MALPTPVPNSNPAPARTPANLRAWAKADPKELEAMESEDNLYKQEGTGREDDEALTAGEEGDMEDDLVGGPLPPEEGAEGEEAEPFDPEELEAYAHELGDQLSEGEGGDEDLLALVEDYDPADGPPLGVQDAELWDGAVDLASEVKEQGDPVFWQLAISLYSYMGGQVGDAEATPPEPLPPPEEEAPEETPEE